MSRSSCWYRRWLRIAPGLLSSCGLGALLALLGGPPARGAEAGPQGAGLQDAGPQSAAAATPPPRQQARDLVAAKLLERAVRPLDLQSARAEAARLVKPLTPHEVRELLRAGDAGALVDRQIARQAAVRSGLRNAAAAALGDAESELLFVPLAPCRIIDTRLVSGGPIDANTSRSFHVAGTTAFQAQGGSGGGCGVPLGATSPVAPAVMINFVAVGPTGPGHLQAWEFGQPMPNAAILSFANTQPTLNIANGVILPISGTNLTGFDISIFAGVSTTHVVADVTGYFTRFPIEFFGNPAKTSIVSSNLTTPVDLGDGACHRLTTCTVTTPAGVTGRVVLRFWAQVGLDHTNGTHDRVVIGSKLGTEEPPNCTPINDQVANSDFEVPDVAPTDSDVDATLSHGRDFAQSGNTTRTYSLLSNMIIGANAGDRVESARLTCMFLPN